LSHSTSPFFVFWFFFEIGSLSCLGWLWTAILLISVSWVARITGESHWGPGFLSFFFLVYSYLLFFVDFKIIISICKKKKSPWDFDWNCVDFWNIKELTLFFYNTESFCPGVWFN
jgi:hypothetical protein